MMQDPCNRERRDVDVASSRFFGKRRQAAKDRVGGEVLVRFRPERHARSGWIDTRGSILAGQPSAGQRAECGEPHALIVAERKQLALRGSIEKAVGILHPLETNEPAYVADPQRTCKPPCFDVARA